MNNSVRGLMEETSAITRKYSKVLFVNIITYKFKKKNKTYSKLKSLWSKLLFLKRSNQIQKIELLLIRRLSCTIFPYLESPKDGQLVGL